MSDEVPQIKGVL